MDFSGIFAGFYTGLFRGLYSGLFKGLTSGIFSGFRRELLQDYTGLLLERDYLQGICKSKEHIEPHSGVVHPCFLLHSQNVIQADKGRKDF